MGDGLEAFCECGYSIHIIIGSSRIDPEDLVEKLPVLCLECNQLQSINYHDYARKCKLCQSEKLYYYAEIVDFSTFDTEKEPLIVAHPIVKYWKQDIQKSFIIRDKEYTCPQCQQVKMKFQYDGFHCY
jgi:Zn finger protein HypA/HybF involved in hydrogenase expression